MFQTSLTFFIVALMAALLGFWWLAGIAATLAKIIFVLFFALFAVSLFFKTATRITQEIKP